jgi:hypothetical protein
LWSDGRCWAAYVHGVLDPSIVTRIASEPSTSASDATASVTWLARLGETLEASASTRSSSGRDDSSLFPLLLLMVPVARLGHVEAVAIYCVARALAGLNTKALAAREGFGSTAYPERDLSVLENYNTEQTILSELLALFDRYFASYSFETYALYAVGAIPLLLVALAWWLVSELTRALLEWTLALGTTDPLTF